MWHLLWIVPVLLIVSVTASRALAGREDDSPPPVIREFRIEPELADPGGEVKIVWTVERAETVTISPAPGEVELAGETTVTAGDVASTYMLTANNGDQRRTSTIQLRIAPQAPVIGYFEAEPAAVNPGQNVVLNWSVVGEAAVVTIEPGDGSMLAPVGSVILQADASTVFTLTATNPAGRTVKTVQVTVGEQALAAPPAITSFTVTPSRIDLSAQGAQPPDSITLAWSATGAESVELVGQEARTGLAGEGTLDLPTPLDTATYFLIASNSGGSTTQEVTIEVVAPSGPTMLTPETVFIPAPSEAEARGVLGPALDGSTSGHTNDGVGAQSNANLSDPLPSVDLLTAAPNPARVGDEIVVRWAVSKAASVSVQTVPAPEGTAPLVARAGVFRFIAKENVAILLEATSPGGSTIRRQVGVRVLDAIAPSGTNVGGDGVPLIAPGGVLGGSAVVNDAGDVWLFRTELGTWTRAGALGMKPVSAAIAGTTLFGVDQDGRVRSLDLSNLPISQTAAATPVAGSAITPAPPAPPRPGATPRAAASPTPLRLGLPVDLGANCKNAVAVAGHERTTGEDGTVVPTLLVACSEPAPLVIALPVIAGKVGSPRWTSTLDETPVALSLGAIDGAVVAVRYPLYSPRSTKVDLLEVASGQAAEVALTGKVMAVTTSPDGQVVVAALFDEAALLVVDRRGAAPRRVALPGEVKTLSWASSAVDRVPEAPGGQTASAPAGFVGGTDAYGEHNPVLPTPTPISAEGLRADGAGSVVVTWRYDRGGALVSLAPWSPTTLIAAEISPGRGLANAVDDGSAIVVIALGPNQGVVFPWIDAARGRP